MYANSQTKQGGIFGKIYPTDLDHDMALIQQLYKEQVGLILSFLSQKQLKATLKKPKTLPFI